MSMTLIDASAAAYNLRSLLEVAQEVTSGVSRGELCESERKDLDRASSLVSIAADLAGRIDDALDILASRPARERSGMEVS